MIKKIHIVITLLAVVFTMGCNRCTQRVATLQSDATAHNMNKGASDTFIERFEAGTKGGYATGNVGLGTGDWNFDNALIGTSASDRKDGAAAVRITGDGKVSMNFDVNNGVTRVDIKHGLYGSDPSASWQLWHSTDGGSTWVQAGSTVVTSSATLSSTTFSINVAGKVRFQIRKLTGVRMNIDDFSISEKATTGANGGTATRDDNMAMGNPSSAGTKDNNNYLLVKPQYALSYNNSKGIANWVSWHLSTAWKGGAARCNCFTADNALPSAFYRATTSNYTATGFDRGHLCPSDDRDASDADNAATFLMTNITPQAPILNQQTWGALETYCRNLISTGNELYIVAGCYGQGGSGSLGGTTNTIASGNINVPAHFYKIVVVLPVGTGDISRISSSTRVIAVDMPNQQSVNSHSWDYYRTSVHAIEASTGYNFLSNVPMSIQTVIEARVDNGATQ